MDTVATGAAVRGKQHNETKDEQTLRGQVDRVRTETVAIRDVLCVHRGELGGVWL